MKLMERIEVDHGIVCIRDVLSAAECEGLIARAEAVVEHGLMHQGVEVTHGVNMHCAPMSCMDLLAGSPVRATIFRGETCESCS